MGHPNKEITENGLFLPSYQSKLCDRFLILQYDASEFLTTLRNELVAAIVGGCHVDGAWGRIAVNSSEDLHYELLPPRFRKTPQFIRSTQVG